MRFLVTFLCMGMITTVAAALVFIDMIIKLLTMLVAVIVVVVALRVWKRLHRAAAAPPALIVGWNVPDAAAFASASLAADIRAAGQGHAGVGMVTPMRRYNTAHPQEYNVIDAEVIDDEDHRRG